MAQSLTGSICHNGCDLTSVEEADGLALKIDIGNAIVRLLQLDDNADLMGGIIKIAASCKRECHLACKDGMEYILIHCHA